MVIEPALLIFCSVPSCAVAATEKPSAPAARTARTFFMSVSPRVMKILQRSRSIAKALRGGREQGDAEGRGRLHQVHEHVAVDGEEGHLRLGDCVGRARRLVDQ